MNLLAETLREVESHAFAARVNVASDLRTFFEAARREPAVEALTRDLGTTAARAAVAARAVELARQKVDPRYENPWDVALAMYLWLMSMSDLQLAGLMAEAVAWAPQCWWARKVARAVSPERLTQSTSVTRQQEIAPLFQKSSDTEDVLLLANLLVETRGPEIRVRPTASINDAFRPERRQTWILGRAPYRVSLQNSEAAA